MTQWKVFHLRPGTDVDIAWEAIEDLGCMPLFVNETPDGAAELVAETQENIDLEGLPFVKNITLYQDAKDIDWATQWALHGQDFRDGYVHLEVGTLSLKLMPGPGFGDLSHPTTHLALELMESQVTHKCVLDVGCGSGVLTLAAVAMGAEHAYGVDIDLDALAHATANAALNDMEDKTLFGESVDIAPDVVVINMIFSEQRLAWQTWGTIAQSASILIASGILVEEGQTYIAYMERWGWSLVERRERDGWLGLTFMPATIN